MLYSLYPLQDKPFSATSCLMRAHASADQNVPRMCPTEVGPDLDGRRAYAATSRETLTDKRLKSLKAAAPGTRYMIHDGRSGLVVRVSDKGERSWIVRPVLGNRRLWFVLGSYPETSLDDARVLARGAFRASADDVDPRRLTRETLRAIAIGDVGAKAAVRGVRSADLTFGELASKFLDSPAVTGKPSEKETRRILATYFLGAGRDDGKPSVDWKDVPVADLDQIEINEALELLVKRGRVMANHAAQTLNRLFRWAAKKGHVKALPIFDTAPGGREESRSRVLADWELREIWQATKTEPVFGPYVRFLAASGLRRTNAAHVKWEHVDREKGLLVVPKTKERRVFVLPLSHLALEAIDDAERGRKPGEGTAKARKVRDRRIEKVDEASEYVFSASAKPLSAWGKMTDRLRRAAPKVEDRWTLHDLRRTMRTGLGELGVEWHIAERCIDHVVGSTAAQTYDRFAYLSQKRDALDRWAAHLRKIVEAKGADG